MRDAIERALIEWRIALGDRGISTDPPTLAEYQANTSEFRARDLLAVLRPSSLEDVRRVIAVARSTRVPVHPISTGRNWGFGSALPAHGPVALVDLGRMDRILDVDARFRYAVIEPGVTQGQLSDHLATLGGVLKFNVTGAGRDTSIVGNILDRGGGNLGPRIDDLLGIEIALGNGEVVRTGLWHLRERGDAIHCYPPGIGPDLRGLFVQSAFGIVTKMALRLYPVAPFLELTLEASEAHLPDLVDELRRARDDSVVTGYMRFSDGADPNIQMFRRTARPTWRAQITVRGPSGIRAEARREIERRIGGLVDRLDTFDTEHDDPQAQTGEARALLEARIALANGIPSNRSLANIAGMAGRSLPDGKADIDHDRAMPGFLCVNVTLPFSGEHVAACSSIVRASAERAGVATSRLFGMIGPTALSGFFPFYFDRRRADEVARAHAFKDELLRRLDAAELYPMRMDIDSSGAFIARTDDGFWRSVSAIERALDPQGIIASRYTVSAVRPVEDGATSRSGGEA